MSQDDSQYDWVYGYPWMPNKLPLPARYTPGTQLKLWFPNNLDYFTVQQNIIEQVIDDLVAAGSLQWNKTTGYYQRVSLPCNQHRKNVLWVLSRRYKGYTYPLTNTQAKNPRVAPYSTLRHRPVYSTEENLQAARLAMESNPSRSSKTNPLTTRKLNKQDVNAITQELVPHIQEIVEEEILRQTTAETQAIRPKSSIPWGRVWLLIGFLSLIGVIVYACSGGIGTSQPNVEQTQIHWPSKPVNSVTCNLGLGHPLDPVTVTVATDGASISIQAKSADGTVKNGLNFTPGVKNLKLNTGDFYTVCLDINGDGITDYVAVKDFKANFGFKVDFNKNIKDAGSWIVYALT